jgi:hypothetical protein
MRYVYEIVELLLSWITLAMCAVQLCKVTQEPTSQPAALLRAAQIVYILSIGALIITSVNSMARFHSTNWPMK